MKLGNRQQLSQNMSFSGLYRALDGSSDLVLKNLRTTASNNASNNNSRSVVNDNSSAYIQSFGGGADLTQFYGLEASNENIELPWENVRILGRSHSHLNITDSVLDSQFVKMATTVECEYRDVLYTR